MQCCSVILVGAGGQAAILPQPALQLLQPPRVGQVAELHAGHRALHAAALCQPCAVRGAGPEPSGSQSERQPDPAPQRGGLQQGPGRQPVVSLFLTLSPRDYNSQRAPRRVSVRRRMVTATAGGWNPFYLSMKTRSLSYRNI